MSAFHKKKAKPKVKKAPARKKAGKKVSKTKTVKVAAKEVKPKSAATRAKKAAEKKEAPAKVSVKAAEKKEAPAKVSVKAAEKKEAPAKVSVKAAEKKEAPAKVSVKAAEKKEAPAKVSVKAEPVVLGAPPEATIASRLHERSARGFSFGELASAGVPLNAAKREGLSLDIRRRSVVEGNVEALRGWFKSPAGKSASERTGEPVAVPTVSKKK